MKIPNIFSALLTQLAMPIVDLVDRIREAHRLAVIEETIELDPWCAWANGWIDEKPLPHRFEGSPADASSLDRATACKAEVPV